MEADDWNFILDSFEDRVLWVCDYSMGDQYLDLPPAVARQLMTDLGIDAEYFLAVPREPGAAGVAAARETLFRLMHQPSKS